MLGLAQLRNRDTGLWLISYFNKGFFENSVTALSIYSTSCFCFPENIPGRFELFSGVLSCGEGP